MSAGEKERSDYRSDEPPRGDLRCVSTGERERRSKRTEAEKRSRFSGGEERAGDESAQRRSRGTLRAERPPLHLNKSRNLIS